MSNELRSGDRVRVTFETTVDEDNYYPYDCLRNDTRLSGYCVELIQPADDPSKDPVGATRRDPATDQLYARLDYVTEEWRSLALEDVEWRSDRQVVGWEKGQPVPGTPAAGQVPDAVVAEARRLMRRGLKIPAIKHLREGIGQDHPLYSLRAAKEFVESL